MKLYICMLCTIIPVSVMGQKHAISVNYKPSLTYFGKQSQSFSHYYFDARKGSQTFNNSLNISYSYELNTKITGTIGWEYAQQGQNISFKADSVHPSDNRQTLKIELDYLRIPLTINYTVCKIKESALSIYSGVSLGIAIKRKDNYQEIILESILLPPPEKRYKNTDWAIPAGINYKTALTPKLYINFGGEYLFGLTNAFEENAISKFGVLSEFDNSKQNRLALHVGMSLSLAK